MILYIIVVTVLWFALAWLLVARHFPNDGFELNPWLWLVPCIPILYYLLFVTGLVMVVVGITVSGLIYKLKNRNET